MSAFSSANPWRFAVDCVTEGRLAALSEAAEIGLVMVCQALNYGLSYTHHGDRRRSGYVTPKDARAVLKTRGSVEPVDPGAVLAAFMQPSSCKPEGQREHWPINTAYDGSRELAVWGLILGIERGWFAYDRSGFLQWSEAGRDRYAARGSAIVVDSRTGQSGFAF